MTAIECNCGTLKTSGKCHGTPLRILWCLLAQVNATSHGYGISQKQQHGLTGLSRFSRKVGMRNLVLILSMFVCCLAIGFPTLAEDSTPRYLDDVQSAKHLRRQVRLLSA
jgi:hypothetical protein